MLLLLFTTKTGLDKKPVDIGSEDQDLKSVAWVEVVNNLLLIWTPLCGAAATVHYQDQH